MFCVLHVSRAEGLSGEATLARAERLGLNVSESGNAPISRHPRLEG